jgi:hypothetical protein
VGRHAVVERNGAGASGHASGPRRGRYSAYGSVFEIVAKKQAGARVAGRDGGPAAAATCCPRATGGGSHATGYSGSPCDASDSRGVRGTRNARRARAAKTRAARTGCAAARRSGRATADRACATCGPTWLCRLVRAAVERANGKYERAADGELRAMPHGAAP